MGIFFPSTSLYIISPSEGPIIMLPHPGCKILLVALPCYLCLGSSHIKYDKLALNNRCYILKCCYNESLTFILGILLYNVFLSFTLHTYLYLNPPCSTYSRLILFSVIQLSNSVYGVLPCSPLGCRMTGTMNVMNGMRNWIYRQAVCMPYLCFVTLQKGGWMPVELKYGAVRVRYIAAERGHCDPARNDWIGIDCLMPNMSTLLSQSA